MSRLYCAIAAVVATMSLGTCTAQKAVTFQSKSFNGGVRPGDIYAVDVNLDGNPDILQDHAANSGWSEILASGPAAFNAPVAIGAGEEVRPQLALAIADFNQDGIPDFAAPVYDVTPNIELKFGTGTGSFNTSFFGFPTSSNRFIAAADFTGSGTPNLLVDSSGVLYIALGSGSGTAVYTAPSGTEIRNVVVGDFNGDGHADIAFVNGPPCSPGSTSCPSSLHVLFGDGNLNFLDTTPYGSNGNITISAGDLDSDGITDLYGVDEAVGQLAIFYGSTSEVFASYFMNLPAGTFGGTSGGFTQPFAMADFNADWKMDLVSVDHNSGTGADSLVFFLSTGTRGGFTTQTVALPKHTFTTNPIVGDFNRDGKPDVVVNQSDGGGSTMLLFQNTTNNGVFSDCIYPPHGINVCSPNQNSVSPVAFSAAATSFGNIRKMELWVDGTKLTQQDFTWGAHAWLHTSASLANGTHSISIKAADIDNQTQTTNFNLTVGPPVCPAPAAAGVTICTPAGGSTVGRPIAVQASATLSGTFSRIDIWLDGVKMYTQKTTPYLSASIPALSGTHTLSVVATNTTGTQWKKTVNVTAQ